MRVAPLLDQDRKGDQEGGCSEDVFNGEFLEGHLGLL